MLFTLENDWKLQLMQNIVPSLLPESLHTLLGTSLTTSAGLLKFFAALTAEVVLGHATGSAALDATLLGVPQQCCRMERERPGGEF